MMSMRTLLIAAGLLLSALPSAAQPGGPPGDLAKAELVIDHSAITPGQRFRAGVRFVLKPAWHIYWRNPGDSGQVTTLQFSLPQGFVVSELRWPVPRKFEQPGDMVGYGYENEVVLWADITAPKDLKKGEAVKLAIDARWLVCRESCFPGNAKFEATVQVADKPEARDAKLFEQWEQRLPGAEAAGLAGKVSTSGALSGDSPRGEFQVQVEWKGSVKDVEWYPAPEKALTVEDVETSTAGGKTTVTFTARALRGQKPSGGALDSVLGYTDESGQRRGMALKVPLGNKE
jgi:thiol:disulfide interchange protein DsbD